MGILICKWLLCFDPATAFMCSRPKRCLQQLYSRDFLRWSFGLNALFHMHENWQGSYLGCTWACGKIKKKRVSMSLSAKELHKCCKFLTLPVQKLNAYQTHPKHIKKLLYGKLDLWIICSVSACLPALTAIFQGFRWWPFSSFARNDLYYHNRCSSFRIQVIILFLLQDTIRY